MHKVNMPICDFERIMRSEKFFARKFDQDLDFEIVVAIYQELKNNKN